jgi:integrase
MPRRNSGPRLRFLKKRGNYYIVWTENGRSRERSTGTANCKLAETALADFLHVRARDAGPREPKEVLVTDVLADYGEERGNETAAPWRIAAAIKVLAPFWEGKTVTDVNRETCRKYVTVRGRAAGTTRRELGVLRAAINHSHRSGRLIRTVPVELPEGAMPRERWLTKPEAASLLKAALLEPRVRLHLPLFILLGLRTGQRKSAILTLRWSQVDLGPRPTIDFNSPGDRRSNKRKARQPISRKLVGHLRRAKRRGTDIGFVVNENGARLKDIKRGFMSACKRAGLNDVTPHVLRHTCATWLMQRGVSLWEAAGFLQMSPETLQRVYGHHCPDHLRRAADALS